MFEKVIPILPVVLPLMAAPLCVIFRSSYTCWLITLITCWAIFICSFLIFFNLSEHNFISYPLGGWDPPLGIEYRIDKLNIILLILLSSFAALLTTFCRTLLVNEISKEKIHFFFVAFLLCLSGLIGVSITSDAFNAFVFMEISSLATYVLIALGKDRRALLASYRYLILGTIGATFFVLGVGIIYVLTGTLNFTEITEKLKDVEQIRAKYAALSFILVGLTLKAALFPAHAWLPNSYTYAPSFASCFLAATSTKVSIYLLIRFIFDIFGYSQNLDAHMIHLIIITLSVCAIFAGSIIAIFQSDIKKLFAFSSISQIGYITLGLGISNELGLTASFLHIINHAITKGLIFILIGFLSINLGQVTLNKIAGHAKINPFLSFSLVVGCLSLIGVPGTVGFISKWTLINAVIIQEYWLLAFFILFASLLSIIYSWKIIESLYFKENTEIASENHLTKNTYIKNSFSVYFSCSILVFLCIFLGLETSYTLQVSNSAAGMMVGIN